MKKWILILILMNCLTACTDGTNYAPVTDVGMIEHIPQSGTYRVQPGETLYSIAWRYGMDYRTLANLNHIAPPYHVIAGQRIVLNRRNVTVIHRAPEKITPVKTPAVTRMEYHPVSPVYPIEQEINRPVTAWRWPARGPITGSYSSLNKGIDIGGRYGSPVYATAAGVVVYNGNGLRGYGHLVIIKHNNTWLTAYAHNSKVLVREGQRISAGQQIAETGMSASGRAMLHFEMRRNGQPVNPLRYLT